VSVKPGAPAEEKGRTRDDFRRVYYFRDRHNGSAGDFERLGDVEHLTLAQAWKAVTDRHADITLNGPRRNGGSDTFDALFAKWIERHAKVNKKSWEHDESLYKRHVKGRLGKKIVDDLRRRDVIDVLDSIADEVTPIQANRCQAIISAVLNWAVAEDILEVNHAHGIRKRGQEAPRARVLKDAELR
jgi:hypothetical protein